MEIIFVSDSGRGPSPLYVQLPNEPVYNNGSINNGSLNGSMAGVPNITTNPMFGARQTPPIHPPPQLPQSSLTPHQRPAPPTYAVPIPLSSAVPLLPTPSVMSSGSNMPLEINKEALKLIEKLGEGEFGEVSSVRLVIVNRAI